MTETPPDLRYVSDDAPGIRRVRRGKGFSYHQPDGAVVAADVRDRINALAIPPAWNDVWICRQPNGHLQATGRDAKGRKQYRYHDRWQEHRNRVKFDRLIDFGDSLPDLRQRVEADLRKRGLVREKVIALAVRLLDETLIRIGNVEYASGEDATYGLTTLRDRHVEVVGSTARFSFVGKSGIEHELEVADRRLARLVKACRDIPGYSLFQYHTEEGKNTIDSSDVNAYLRDVMGDDVTAKDFRTWGGTVRSAERLAGSDIEDPETSILDAIKTVSAELGNTVAVCRRYYIHPDILDAHRAGVLRDRVRRRNAGNTPAGLRPHEAAVLDLLRDF